MASKPLIIASLLGASIGVPYFASQSKQGEDATGSQSPTPAAAPAQSAPALAAVPPQGPIESPGLSINGNAAPWESARLHSAEQVLRFDLTNEWVYRNWARKSTGPTDVGLFAVRVPLVTGTQIASLAGSLTYYFNTHGQVEHISFRGRTGDTTPLVSFLARTYEFERAEAPVGEQLYQVKRGRRVQSELRTRPEPVLLATSPHNSIAVELELARPGSRRFLPPRTPQLEIPQTASTPLPEAAPSANSSPATTTGTPESAGSSFLDKFRRATPQEEGRVLWKRWPD
jgi:hypothetical protein